MTNQESSTPFTLTGSASIILEFFEFAIHSILYQRGLYPPESFEMKSKYGLQLLVSRDDQVQSYIQQFLSQVEKWVISRTINKLVLVIVSKDTSEVLERWQFDLQLEGSSSSTEALLPHGKTEKQIHSEISAILRQITASVSFLPLLQDSCTFNILAYTDKNAQVPHTWVDSDARLIQDNEEQVKFRSFSTAVHRVEPLVSYKVKDV